MDKSELVWKYTNQKIIGLSVDSPVSKANLARLRRGAGKDIRDSNESWAIVLDGMPSELCGYDSSSGFVPSPAENAIHTALTVFAIHFQGRGSSPNTDTVSFAKACCFMANDPRGNPESIKRRFDAIMSSSDIVELSQHIRGMVQMMRTSDRVSGFDYRRLAKDLYYYQYPNGKRNVMISWGQDFYSNIKTNDKKE